jgi:hypothetical protein
MSFLYPRTVSIHRPTPNTGAGALGYSGETAANETVVLTGLPASIQHRGARGKAPGNLPADAQSGADWYVFIPAANAALGTIAERDIVVDDIGKRYQVIAAYASPLGHRLAVTLLEM